MTSHSCSELPSYSELKQKHASQLLWATSQLLSRLKYDTDRGYSELLPSCSELKRDTHRSYSELLPSYSELAQDAHRSYPELLHSYSELKYNVHHSCSKRLPWAASYSTRNCFSELVSFSSELKTLDGLIWDIKYKLGTNSISSNSQKFSWIS